MPPTIDTGAADGWMKEGYPMKGQSSYGGHATKAAPAQSRPEPQPFVFRPRRPKESEAEYRDMENRARERYNKLVDRNGRAKAVKGRLNAMHKEIAVESS